MKKKTTAPKFPANLLTPVTEVLNTKLKSLEKKKKAIGEEDPFKDTDRVNDNAASDIEADEQFGHARTSAIRSEISRAIIQIRKALTRIKVGKYGTCEVCGQMIDTDRLIIYPEATLCAKDAAKREKK
ncbi:MAG: TraR/DksA family transcriptional regulator [Candidatus Methanofastidiosa archaeon]|nr:TraR/DksA family transcriptional regulator [Candidatus Methanofastidiosa archaeon]